MFWASNTRDIISMVTPYSARISAVYFLPFGNVWFGCFRVQRVGITMQNLRSVGENSDPIVSRLWTNVHEIFRLCRKSLVLSNALFRFFCVTFHSEDIRH